MIAGDSSVARKSTSVGFCKRIVEAVEPDRVGPRDYTVEALMKWMAEKDPATKKGRNKVSLFAEEFGADLARMAAYAKTMATDFCALYDGETFEKIRSGSAAPLRVERPRVNLFAAAAYQMLSSYLTSNDWMNGYLMLFVYVAPASLRPKNLIAPQWPQFEYDNARVALTVLRDDIVMHKFKRLPFDPRARSEFEKWTLAVDQYSTGIKDNSGAKHTYVSRFTVNVQKLALLYQIDMDPNAPVSLDAVLRAVDFAGRVCWPSFSHVYESTTRDDFLAALSSVTNALSERPMMKHDLEARFRSRVVKSVIDHLVWSGHIIVAKSADGDVCSLKRR
jgi:hypothetical protein